MDLRGISMKLERVHNIADYISKQQFVTIPELCEKFQVSINTVRRDLTILEEEGKIEKIYGGARLAEEKDENTTAPPKNMLRPFLERTVKNPAAKEAIAKAAARLISEGDTIYIDTGTSTTPLLNYITSLKHLNIITNSVKVMNQCLGLPQFNTICLPGVMKHATASVIGDQCLKAIDLYHIDKAFMACSAFSLQLGASNSSVEEYTIKQKILSRSSKHYLLVDHTKFDCSSLMVFAQPNEFDCIITDEKPPLKYQEYFEKNEIQYILCGTA